jgi:hypothetical protein
VNPQLGGTLSGLPLGLGLSVYFISFEQGIDFALAGVAWGIAALSAAILLGLVYFLMAKLTLTGNKNLSMLITAISSVLAFLFIGFLISLVNFNVAQATALFIVVFIGNILIVSKLIGSQEECAKPATTMAQLVIRGVLVGVILILITGSASLVGSKWAIILSSFPMIIFPLLLVLHFEAGHRLVQFVIFGFSYSVSTLLVFYLSFLYFVPTFGLNIGFLFIYAVCIVYIYTFKKIQDAVFKGIAAKQKERCSV